MCVVEEGKIDRKNEAPFSYNGLGSENDPRLSRDNFQSLGKTLGGIKGARACVFGFP